MKKLRMAFQFNNADIVSILALANVEMSENELSAIFRTDDHPKYVECEDDLLNSFLNGLVTFKRGAKKNKSSEKDILQDKENMVKKAFEKKAFGKDNTARKQFKKKSFKKKSTEKKPYYKYNSDKKSSDKNSRDRDSSEKKPFDKKAFNKNSSERKSYGRKKKY